MGGVIGLDVGGANTKAVWRVGDERRALSRPFEVWGDREALAAVIREVVAGVAAEPAEVTALTTTAELSDAFRTKREGVEFVLDAAETALDGPSCSPSRPPGNSSRSRRRGRAQRRSRPPTGWRARSRWLRCTPTP